MHGKEERPCESGLDWWDRGVILGVPVVRLLGFRSVKIMCNGSAATSALISDGIRRPSKLIKATGSSSAMRTKYS